MIFSKLFLFALLACAVCWAQETAQSQVEPGELAGRFEPVESNAAQVESAVTFEGVSVSVASAETQIDAPAVPTLPVEAAEAGTAETCVPFAEHEADRAAWEAKLAPAVTLAQDLGAELAAARESMLDLQRTAERRKNEVVTTESLLKNCNLDKTVASEASGRQKAVIAKLQAEVEGLKKQLAAGKGKGSEGNKLKCPACVCPAAPACAACKEPVTCPPAKPCRACRPSDAAGAQATLRDACPPFWTATNTSGVTAQHCAALFVQESQRAAREAHNWTVDTCAWARGHWLKVRAVLPS